MKLLKERILKEGHCLSGNILKVDLESPSGTKSTIRIALRTGGADK